MCSGSCCVANILVVTAIRTTHGLHLRHSLVVCVVFYTRGNLDCMSSRFLTSRLATTRTNPPRRKRACRICRVGSAVQGDFDFGQDRKQPVALAYRRPALLARGPECFCRLSPPTLKSYTPRKKNRKKEEAILFKKPQGSGLKKKIELDTAENEKYEFHEKNLLGSFGMRMLVLELR